MDEVIVTNNNAAPGTSAEVAGTGAVEVHESESGPEMMNCSPLRAGFRVIQIPINDLPRMGTSSITADPVQAFFLGLKMIGGSTS